MPDGYGKLELRHLRYFVAVAEEGSLTEAARVRLNTAQPSLSRQLREMENELGGRLFERRPRGVALTPSGRRLLEHCRDILARLDEAVNDTRGTRTILRLGCLAGLEPDILPRVTQLAKPHAPEVEIQVVSAPSPRLVELLRARALDFAKVMDDIDAYGGVVKAIEDGWLQMRMAERATERRRKIDSLDTIVVGQNAFRRENQTDDFGEVFKLDPKGAARVLEKFEAVRARRDHAAVQKSLDDLAAAAANDHENLMPYLIDCCHAYATVGEIVKCLKNGWGEFQEPVRL